MEMKHTSGPWIDYGFHDEGVDGERVIASPDGERMGYAVACVLPCGEPDMKPELTLANARLIAAAPELLEALHEGRRAIGDHFAPNDCYATGPLTGDGFRDLVQCPACNFIAMYDAVIAKAMGEQT